MNLFETSLPIRLDYEAMLAYLLLPPAGGVLLLVLEHKSDYVRLVSSYNYCGDRHNNVSTFVTLELMAVGEFRFHAWQSSMVFAVMFVCILVPDFIAYH